MAGNAGVAKAVVADTNPMRTTHGGLNDSSTSFFETFVPEEVGSCVGVGWGGAVACVERYCPFVGLPVCDHRSCGIASYPLKREDADSFTNLQVRDATAS
eukprot:scaffold38036_cov50-Attheya_sp.AAC.4